MKKIAITITVTATILISTAGFGKGGFSLGVFGSYAVDGGAIEKIIDSASYPVPMAGTSSKYDPVIIPGAGVFAQYDFSNNLFIRTGSEFNQMVSGGNISTTNGAIPTKVEIKYKAVSIPLFFGINISPDKGKTSFYGAAGLIFSNIEISYSSDDNNGIETYESDKNSSVFGFGALLGIEKNITKNTFFMIEYTFYKCEQNKNVSMKHYLSGPQSDVQYTERFGLPRQQIRLGAGYAF